jgi:aspartyl-tRNA(Asn)/glutamyl-tRNA(Gln) amidotransferase subunit B
MSTLATLETVIGLEVHVQLNTKSKIFSSDNNDFGNQPNSDVGASTLAHPGTLPMVSKEVIDMGIKLGIALEGTINRNLIFDRKNYFYPDLPKGYQITQDATPVCKGGIVKIRRDDCPYFDVKLTKIHLEEDAGKSIHVKNADFTNLDLNRSGVPLLEIVTEPMIASSEQAGFCLIELRKLVRYLGISDGNMERGSLRCDANISLRSHGTTLGNKVEIKNMNSIKNVRKAIDHEVQRQTKMILSGQAIISETRTYNAHNNTTSSMRKKEELNDYRYFPEPDISPIIISDEWYESIKKSIPVLPDQVKKTLIKDYGLPNYDAQLLSDDRSIAEYFFRTANTCRHYKAISNWIMGPIRSYLNENEMCIGNLNLCHSKLADLINAVQKKEISLLDATRQVFRYLTKHSDVEVKDAIVTLGLAQVDDFDEIQQLIINILVDNPDKVKEYHNGKKGILGMFMGLVMKKSGKIRNPQKVNTMIKENLEKIK